MKVKKLIFALLALALVALIGFGIYDLYDYCKNKPDFNVSDTLPDGGGKALIERVETRHGLRQLSYMKELGMGNDRYTLIDIDNGDAVITAAEAVKDVKPGWTPDRYNTFWGRNRH